MARVSGSSLPVSSYTTMPTLSAPLPMPALRPGLLLAVRGRPFLPLLLAPPPFTPAPAFAPADGPAPFAPRFGRDSIGGRSLLRPGRGTDVVEGVGEEVRQEICKSEQGLARVSYREEDVRYTAIKECECEAAVSGGMRCE